LPVEAHYSPLGRMEDVKRPERFEMLFSCRDLPGGFEAAVAKWLEGANNLDQVYRLFLRTVYNPRSYLAQRFLNLVQALEVYHRKILFVPDLRHSCLSLLAQHGEPIRDLQALAGHATAAFTLQRYTHHYDASAKRTAEAIDVILSDEL
jgi:integrase